MKKYRIQLKESHLKLYLQILFQINIVRMKFLLMGKIKVTS